MDNPYSPETELFRRDEVGRPYLNAVLELCSRAGQSLDQMEFCTLRQIADLAIETYGDELPEFWRVWIDWQRPEKPPAMGDLNEPT